MWYVDNPLLQQIYLYRISDLELNTTTYNFHCASQLPQGFPLSLVIKANYPTNVSIGNVPIEFYTGK